MEEYALTVQNPLGMHARPAGMLVKLSKSYRSTIEIQKGGQSVNVGRILAVMGLGIQQGDEITFTVSGADEREAMAQVREICREIL